MAVRRSDLPRIFNIATGLDFAQTLVAGIIERHGDPATWPDIQLLLPNRRAIEAVRTAFLQASNGKAALLPRIQAIGDVEIDDLFLEDPGFAEGFALDPAIDPLHRVLLLTPLIDRYFKKSGQAALVPAQAAALAALLGRLIDQVHVERLDFARLRDLAPERFADHWRLTLRFLEIITEAWPRILADQGLIDPGLRQTRLIEARAQSWRDQPPGGPVIAAGSTGTLPAVADLLFVVARLPQGAIVLPGLDRDAVPDDWQAIGPAHPQGNLKALVEHLGVDRAEVADWRPAILDPPIASRVARIRRTLAPAARIAEPGTRHLDPLPKLRLIEAAQEREEAAAIALLLREALETPGRTAALVTADPGLGRRVVAELGRWGIRVDHSAGEPLARAPVGRYLRLLAEALAKGAEPIALLSLLKHPLAGGDQPGFRGAVRTLELDLLRGVRPAPGLDGLAAAATGRNAEFVAGLAARLTRFAAMLAEDDIGLGPLVEGHIAAAEALAGGPERLWRGDDGNQAAGFFARLGAADALVLAGRDYPALFTSLIAEEVVRSPARHHPRLAIWSPIEARMQSRDLMILGGLNEGGWPAEIRPDPWMSEPMRRDFGLPAAARRIGLAAHDFVQGLGAPEVVLSRATKIDGAPSVPSRWLQRLDALDHIARDPRYVDWARALDACAAPNPCPPPEPRPPQSARPNQLSVTAVELWMRDPYALYAREILRLRPLDPIDQDPGGAERGTLIHRALERFLKEPGPRSLDRLLLIGGEEFGDLLDRPAVWGFWWPRFEAAARWFVATEEARPDHRTLALEAKASWPLPNAPTDFPFTLIAKADRIDLLPDGGLAIIDYKTGTIPSQRQIEAGFAPQLPLEGALAQAGMFAGVAALPVAALEFWQLCGGGDGGKITAVNDPSTRIDDARTGLVKLVASFARADTPYLSSPRPLLAKGHDYDHLARVAEWRGEAEDGE